MTPARARELDNLHDGDTTRCPLCHPQRPGQVTEDQLWHDSPDRPIRASDSRTLWLVVAGTVLHLVWARTAALAEARVRHRVLNPNGPPSATFNAPRTASAGPSPSERATQADLDRWHDNGGPPVKIP